MGLNNVVWTELNLASLSNAMAAICALRAVERLVGDPALGCPGNGFHFLF